MKPYIIAKKKFDTVWIGALVGLAIPLLVLYCFYLFNYSHLSFFQFYSNVLLANSILLPSISLCVVSNLLVFFIFIWINRYYSARGVLLATMIYTGLVVAKKCL
jgi:hypothetical protein